MMILVNNFINLSTLHRQSAEILVKLIAPFAPHMCEELWNYLGFSTSISFEPWPEFKEMYLLADTVNISIQVNGKLRGDIEVEKDMAKDKIIALAAANKKLIGYLKGKDIIKEIYVPGRLVNFVVR